MGIEAAIIGSAVIGAGAGIAGSKMQSSAAKKSAATSAKAAASERALQERMYQQQRRDFEKYYGQGRQALNANYKVAADYLRPYERYGGAATNRLAALAGVNGQGAQLQALQSDPGYQFRMQQGIQAADRSAAARGMLLSGGQQKALTEFGQGLASSELNNAFNRVQSVQAGGQNAANTLGSLYSNRGNALANAAAGQASNLGQLATGTTNALTNISQNNTANQAQAQQAIGQARASAFTNVANAGTNAVGNALFYQALQAPRAPQVSQSSLMNAQGQYPMGLL